MSADAARLAELVSRLGAVRARLAEACQSAGRPVADVTLIAVTKGFPAADVAALASLGVRNVGEARDQEARPKVEALAADGGGDGPSASERPQLRWHMVGQLQSNKARSVVRWASLVHTVDRPSLIEALASARRAAAEDAADPAPGPAEPLEVLLQLSLDGDPARGGATREQLGPLADQVAAAPELRLRGLMVVAPLGADPAQAFETAAAAAAALRADHPSADLLSAGMSGDFERAIAFGATHVRVGTALLGERSTFV